MSVTRILPRPGRQRLKPQARLKVAEQSARAAEEAAEVADSEGKSKKSFREAERARLQDGHAAELQRQRDVTREKRRPRSRCVARRSTY